MTDKTQKPQLFAQLVNDNTKNLNDIFKKLQQIESLQKLWLRFVPDNLRACTKVANYRDDSLIISVASAVWATELRFNIPNLLETLRKEGKLYQLRSISYFVDPGF